MRININLSSHPYVDVGPLIKRLRTAVTILGAVTACLIVVFLVARAQHKAALAEAHQLDRTLESESTELKSYKSMMQRPDIILLADRTSALNQLFDEKAFSWTILMKDLEGVLPPQVQMATIEPIRGKDGSISLQIHLTGPRANAIGFLENLERSPRFVQPRIGRESTQSDTRGSQGPPALSDTSVEEFDIVAGYDVSQSPGAEPVDHGADISSLQAAITPRPVPGMKAALAIVNSPSVHRGGGK